MKKVLALLFAFVFALTFVNAEEVNVEGDSSQNVTVGNVETPVYGIIVNWEGLVYDWAYMADTSSYGWKNQSVCEVSFDYDDTAYAEEAFNEWLNEDKKIYNDNECTFTVGEYEANTTYYTLRDVTPMITLEDMSTGGTITPSITYTAANGYDFTTMSFEYYTTGESHVSITGSTVPNEARLCMKGDENGPVCTPDEYSVYILYPVIGIDNTKTITTPTAGATIGTITLTFATN